MRKIITFIAFTLLSVATFAQSGVSDKRHHKSLPPRVEEIVSDLTPIQQKRIETITQNTKKVVEPKKAALNKIRRQIDNLMEKSGDQSKKLFPLLEKEAQLKVEISKAMYEARVLIDGVLTPAQLKAFRAQLNADRAKQRQCPPPPDVPRP